MTLIEVVLLVTGSFCCGLTAKEFADAVEGEGTVLAHLARTDEVVVEASGGEDFGSIHVRRKIGYDLLVFGGLFLLVGGVVVSFWGANQCNSDLTRGHALDVSWPDECLAIGFGGAAASLAGGVTLMAFGSYGRLTITATGVGGRF